jgi:hypothetical protein
MLKHGFIVLSATLEHTQDWDEQLPKNLFGYCCKVQANIKFFLHMLTSWMPRLKVDDFFSSLV